MDARGLLYRDGAERERLLDMGTRLAPAQLRALALLLIPAAAAPAVYGWLMLLPLVVAGLFFAVTNLPVIRGRWGDCAAFTAWVVAQVMVMVSLALADGPIVYILCLPIFPMLLAATGFRRGTVIAGALLTMVALIVVTLATARDQIAEIPPALWVPALLLLVITLSAMAVRDADMVTRDDAVVDELTGLLNRVALQARVAEITHQVRATHERVALLVIDLDHFKRVNDTLGHSAGDDVLVAAAERLADAAGDLPVYRFGGEEFVVLSAGTDECGARELGERLRAAVAEAPIRGLDLTASFGIAVSAPDDGFEYRDAFARADAALYAAKSGGRDRVCVAGDIAGAPEPDTPVADRLPATPDDAWAVRAPDARDGSWLVRDAVSRAHLVDIVGRTRSFNLATSALTTVAILSMVPWIGWQLLIPVVITGVIVDLATRAVVTIPRPEWAFLGGFVAMQLGAAVAVLVAGPAVFFALPIFAIAMYGFGASLPGRGTAVLVVVNALAMTAATLAAGADEIAANPVILLFPLALGTAMAIVGSAMGARVAELRVAAISDGLTGTLNRVALEARLAELTHRPAGREAVAVIVADLDHFKAVNDANGHEAGDRVLAEVAYRMRGQLRAFDAIYRIGGEEFVILLPGTGVDVAAAVAERVRVAVQQSPAAGVDVTVSLGVAGSPAATPFDYDATFGMADAGLLAAKREGRNRVVVAGTTVVEPNPGGTRATPTRTPPDSGTVATPNDR